MDKYGRHPSKDHVYCDIDGTLLIWPEKAGSGMHAKRHGLDPLVNKNIVDLLKKYKKNGNKIFLWSMGGEEHARYGADVAGISDIVDGYAQKPTVVIDDSICFHLRRTCINQDGKVYSITKDIFKKIRRIVGEAL